MRTRTREVYETLYQIYTETGKRPTIEWIASRMNPPASSRSTVYYALRELVSLKLVKKHKSVSEGIYIPRKPPGMVNWEALAKKGDGDGRKTLENQ
jgi:Fe2+ or Zn2+ uptake regulation protein